MFYHNIVRGEHQKAEARAFLACWIPSMNKALWEKHYNEDTAASNAEDFDRIIHQSQQDLILELQLIKNQEREMPPKKNPWAPLKRGTNSTRLSCTHICSPPNLGIPTVLCSAPISSVSSTTIHECRAFAFVHK
eukprot:TRINITY_DN68505_c0_g1_i1.p1 TRINITY_DN68505_c0_g1~~TRINITY_DN68505_c0_g1_i1.p1  ORF type:complete len:134 (+),score=0.41 TRINITY_DN68505_c0_g1_i1:78-479(+)